MSTAPEMYVARSRKVAARLIGDEMMIMAGGDSTIFTLNPTATLLWQAADGTTPLAAIVEQHICPAFDVESATALLDAQALVADLAEQGILVVSNAPLSDADASSQDRA